MQLSSFVTALLLASTTTAGEKAARKGPLANLPSPPGPHVAKIKAMKDGDWLMLGPPAPDPQWGAAPGRAYTNKMAYAPELVVGFLFGEGVHGKHGNGKREGHYNDDVFFLSAASYDEMALRGADIPVCHSSGRPESPPHDLGQLRAGTTKPLRYSRVSWRLASSSPTKRSVFGSIVRRRPSW
jgi:hypothetical protein